MTPLVEYPNGGRENVQQFLCLSANYQTRQKYVSLLRFKNCGQVIIMLLENCLSTNLLGKCFLQVRTSY